MCGICGFTGYRQDQKTVIERMMKAIEHRGPDSEGSFCREKITLGFRRLSIIDLEDGQQPMESADGNLHIVFNGEIYNYKELRAELEAFGISFCTHSDTEVLINTIQQYGEKALDKLRGMFGFAVWNEQEQSLMLARDFFGIKPVYYAEIDGHFVFASEIKSILAFPGYERKVNQKALEQYLSFQYSPLEETFFRGIYKLMPGHMLLYKNGNYEIKTYFKTKLAPGQWDRKTNMEQLQNQLAENLKDSVEHHMLSDVEVGAFLSGGVDSGYLASSSGADQAFTVGFDEGDRYSEVNKAAKVAEKAGLKHHVKIISKQEFWDALPDVMYHMDEPLGDASAVALYFLSKEAAGHVKVVLSGEGADELFGGYNIYREPESLKKIAWIPFGVRRVIGKLAAKLPDARYKALDAQYAKEQDALEIEIAELEKAVTGYEQSQKSAEKFIALIDKYENFDTLTNTMLNEFVEKILVHERARKGSQDTTQEIEIYFNFLGRYIPPSLQPVPLTPEEQEELRKKEERKDRLHQNYLKRKASGAQKRYEDKIKAKKKAEMDAKKALIRAEDMKKGVFSTVGQLPKEEPRKGSIAASAAV